jgi:hypothetical protein
MVMRRDETTYLSTHEGPRWQEAGDGRRAWWDARPAEETGEDEPPRLSLARKLETDRSFLGRSACWLFIKGGMVALTIPGLIVLGLLAGILRGH